MKRSKFNLSHRRLLTCDMGLLVPIGLTEILPGDTVQMSSTALVRLQPMIAPPMHQINANIAHFFVPHRLVWSEWEDFITGGPQGTSLPVHPYVTVGTAGTAISGLLDYYGYPTGATPAARNVNALPIRGYNAIWNDWFRDQDLQTGRVYSLASGADTTTATGVARVNWEKDYFTGARPWEQKGPTITVPLGTTAPIVLKGTGQKQNVRRVDTHALSAATALASAATGELESAGGTIDLLIDPSTTHQVSLSSASAVTVNVLRQALALQRFEEARARFGSRYTEYLRYLGVRSSDARLQNPEYLGGGSTTVQISEVLSTNAVDTGDPLGTMGGHGIGGTRSNRFRRFFEEHGYIHSFIYIRPKALYMDAVPRHWIRTAKEQYWQKELQFIGQQQIQNQEVYVKHATPTGVFGYNDRYEEYRRTFSHISGAFRNTTMNFWHFGRAFAATPALNSSFVECVPPETPFAVPSMETCMIMVKNNIAARRVVSRNATAKIL